MWFALSLTVMEYWFAMFSPKNPHYNNVITISRKKGLRQNNIGGAIRKGWRSGERSEGGKQIIAFLSS
jgi:hypothetical protein